MIVKISPTITQAQRRDPRFLRLLQECEAFFKSGTTGARKAFRLTSLHESGHITYARLLGATDIRFHGPTMFWCDGCAGCSGDAPAISNSSVSWTWPANVDTTAALKANLGGIVFREVLSDTRNDEIAIERDMKHAREWYRQHVGSDEVAFLREVAVAKEEIKEDLKFPAFRELAWTVAKEFEKAIFPAPKLTSAMLRARRLGWAQ